MDESMVKGVSQSSIAAKNMNVLTPPNFKREGLKKAVYHSQLNY